MVDESAVKATLILGIGNLVMSDDAIGVMVVQQLHDEYDLPANVEIMDGGTLGLDILPKLENLSRLLIIDAIETGSKPGTCLRLEGDDIPIALQTKLSPHQMGLKDLLAVSELTGHLPEEMVLIGIQPASIEMEVGLTPEVESAYATLIGMVMAELERWQIEVKLKS